MLKSTSGGQLCFPFQMNLLSSTSCVVGFWNTPPLGMPSWLKLWAAGNISFLIVRSVSQQVSFSFEACKASYLSWGSNQLLVSWMGVWLSLGGSDGFVTSVSGKYLIWGGCVKLRPHLQNERRYWNLLMFNVYLKWVLQTHLIHLRITKNLQIRVIPLPFMTPEALSHLSFEKYMRLPKPWVWIKLVRIYP